MRGPNLGPCLNKLLLAIALLSTIAMSAVGCREASSRKIITLWHQMRPSDRAVLQTRIDQFEQQNPGVQVRALYKETEELRSGLESAVLVGHGPHIVYGPSDPLGVYQEIGALQDLTQWFDQELDAFDPEALVYLPTKEQIQSQRRPTSEAASSEPTQTDSQSVDSKPLVMIGDRFGNHVALVYNRNLIAEPPETTAEFLKLAKANTIDENGDGRPDRYGLVWNYTEPFFVIPFLTGYDAWVFEEESTAGESKSTPPVPNLDTPEAVAAYQFVSDLRTKHKVLPESADYEAAASLFLAGKAAMLIDGDWSWQRYLSAEGIDAAVAPLPVVSETGLPMGPMVAPKGYSLSVSAQGETADLAAELIRFLTSADTQQVFLEEQKILPSRTALRDSPLLTEDATLVASIQQMNRGRPMPTATEMRAVWDAMRPSYQRLMAGNIDPSTAAAEMQKAALSKIATLTSTVEPDWTAPLVMLLGVGFVLGLMVRFRKDAIALVKDIRTNRLAYLLVLPALLLIFLTVLFPLAYNIVLSFSNMSLQNFSDWEIVGLHNYQSLFSGDDSDRFWGIFAKTIFWTVINVFFHVVLGVLLAVTLNGPVRGKWFYRVALIIPWAVPAYITALTWRGMFDGQFGAVNHLVVAINRWLPEVLHLPELNWLNEAGPAFAACIIANIWLGFPFIMVIALGGLQGIPQDLYEAARIDRASRWQQFWNITVPMLKPVLLPAITLGAVWTFNNLNVVWLVSNGGEPSDQTHILVSYVYRAVFNLYQYGYGAALSMVIFGMLLLFSVLFLQRTKAAQGVY